MSDQGPGAANIVAGIFLILAGLCLTLLGGGCSVLLLSMIGEQNGSGSSVVPLLLLAVAIFGGGIALVWLGIRLMSGRANKPD